MHRAKASLNRFTLLLASLLSIPVGVAAQSRAPSLPAARGPTHCLPCIVPAGATSVPQGGSLSRHVLPFQSRSSSASHPRHAFVPASVSNVPSKRFWGALLG